MPIQFLFNVYFALAVGAESVHPLVYMLASSSQGQHLKGNDQTTFMPMDSLSHIDTYLKKTNQKLIFIFILPFSHMKLFLYQNFLKENSFESSSYCISL